jgi:CRP-like cAMP-binding protein
MDALEPVQLERHKVLIEPDKRFEHVYFPQSCMISIVTLLESGEVIESATIGSEGVVGLPLFLGLETVNTRAICQMPGQALRMRSDSFRKAIGASPALRTALGLYTQTLIAMLGQGGACIGSHSVEQRLARWLLTISDRVGADEFSITQEFLAQMLGAQRPTVTVTAGLLQSAGFIKYRHGHIEIVDRPNLEDSACECYELIRRLYEETFKRIQPQLA